MGEETVIETQEAIDTLPVPKQEEAVKKEGKKIFCFNLTATCLISLFIHKLKINFYQIGINQLIDPFC